jgi:GH24 family phage-related lysozyme (muramidase)
MNLDILKEELIVDEGIEYEIYKDHLGFPTFGIGHLITKRDPEYNQPIGTPVDEFRITDAFIEDVENAIDDAYVLYNNFTDFPEEVQHIIINMLFNMGYTRLSKFKKMKKAVKAGNWQKAADEMYDSVWATQVPNRANRLIERMRNVS